MKKASGFTLIELIVVIIIIGILAAIAIPRFINQTSNARTAAVKGLDGAIQSAMALVYAQAQSTGATGATGTVTMADGTSVTTAYGYPDTTGIGTAMQSIQGFTNTAGSFTITGSGLTAANCGVVYAAATAANAPATATLNTGGC